LEVWVGLEGEGFSEVEGSLGGGGEGMDGGEVFV